MKKKVGLVLGIIIVILGGVYFSKNYIIKKVLESKLTEINKGKVDIGRVDLSLLDKKVTIENIDLTSRKDGMKNFISIGKFSADYDIYFKEKKVLVSQAEFDKVEFMTPRETDGSIGYVVPKKVEVIEDKSGELEKKKDDSLKDLEELIQARAMVNKLTLQNILQSHYDEVEAQITAKKDYWNEKLKLIEKNPEYVVLKANYKKLANEKNPLKLIRMEKEIKNMASSFKVLSKEILKDKEEIKSDFTNIIKKSDIEKDLERSVKELIGRGEFVITDLDSIINYYLNEIYGSEIQRLVEKYRNLMEEVELRRDEDALEKNKWEIFVEDININSHIYGIELKGEIKNISSRLSRNKDKIELYLFADSKISHGEAYGYVDLNKIQGKVNINISNFSFEDVKDMDVLNKYVENGEASLVKEILLSKENIDVRGDVQIQDMNLNSEEILTKLNIKTPFLKTMSTPILKELRSGNVHYEYNSVDQNLVIKSDLSEEIMDILNDKDGIVKKKITDDLLREGRRELKNYEELLNSNNDKVVEELEGELNSKTKYLDKVQEILDRFNLGGILEKF